MSWAEVKKINDNMSIPLDQLFSLYIAGGMRQYIYDSQNYTIPYDGTYTIRAYCGKYGSYGKIIRKCKKGEILNIIITNNELVQVVSNLEDNAAFHINLAKDSYVNGNSANGIKGIAIGGAEVCTDGGNAYIRCNNGIAAGGGGSGGINTTYPNGYNGGAAYAYGDNVYAMGGGGGGTLNNASAIAGLGGIAYVNGEIVDSLLPYDDTNEVVSLASGKGANGGAVSSRGGEGGYGGCGGGAGANRLLNTSSARLQCGGIGYFSDGGLIDGASARGGNFEASISTRLFSNNTATASALCNSKTAMPKGYFVGGSKDAVSIDGNASGFSVNGVKALTGGTGGFLGGIGGGGKNTVQTESLWSGHGGYSPYGIGGRGGNFGGTNNGYHAGSGGDGKLIGGTGGNVWSRYGDVLSYSGDGGNGYVPGKPGANGFYKGQMGSAMTANMIIGTLPLRDMTPDTSIVIIEYGDSPEDF